MCGPPASGKSTWANKALYYWVNLGLNCVYVSRDNIRFATLSSGEGYFAHEQEVIVRYYNQIYVALLDKSVNIVIADATHLTPVARKKLLNNVLPSKSELGDIKIDITPIYFPTDLDTCLQLNAQRTGRACVPEAPLTAMYESFKIPTLEEDSRYTEIYPANELDLLAYVKEEMDE